MLNIIILFKVRANFKKKFFRPIFALSHSFLKEFLEQIYQVILGKPLRLKKGNRWQKMRLILKFCQEKKRYVFLSLWRQLRCQAEGKTKDILHFLRTKQNLRMRRIFWRLCNFCSPRGSRDIASQNRGKTFGTPCIILRVVDAFSITAIEAM
jgi:hypothetical protein